MNTPSNPSKHHHKQKPQTCISAFIFMNYMASCPVHSVEAFAPPLSPKNSAAKSLATQLPSTPLASRCKAAGREFAGCFVGWDRWILSG